MVLDKLISREKKLTIKKRDAEILAELRKPQEDSELANQKDLPDLQRLPGLKLTGQALSDLLMVFEFLHNFGETLGFGECLLNGNDKTEENFYLSETNHFNSQTWIHFRRFKVFIKHSALRAPMLKTN